MLTMLTDASCTAQALQLEDTPSSVFLKESILLLLLLPSRVASCRFARMTVCRAAEGLQNRFLSCPVLSWWWRCGSRADFQAHRWR